MRTPISGNSRHGRLAALAIALACALPARAEIPVDTVTLQMKPLDAKVLFRKDPFDKSSFPVKVLAINGDDVNLAGRIEVKGSFTRRTGKPSVLIKLDGKWKGQGRLSYNGMGTDATMMREFLAWDLMHTMGMVTPQTRYTRLVINGEEQGLFLYFQWIDTKLFEKAGLGDDGEMFHPWDSPHCGDLTPASLDPDLECWLKLAPRGSKDLTALKQLVDEIDATPVDDFDRLVDRRFDADSVLNWFAVNGLVSSSDTYNKNYFLYLSKKTGRWLVVPWDYDITWGRSYDPFGLFPADILNDYFQYYYPIETGQPNPLHYQALKNRALRARVTAKVRELIDGVPDAAHPWRGWFARVGSRIDELHAFVSAELDRHATMAPERQKFEDEVEALRFFARARSAYLRQVLIRESGAPRDTAGIDAGGNAVDGWGYLLAVVAGRDVQGGRVDVVRGWPELVPDGVDRAACVQRTWLIAAPGAIADLTLDYLDEGSHLREVGPAVTDERALHLYARDDVAWRDLPATAAPLADTLSSRGVKLPTKGPLRLVACEPAPPPVAAAN